MSNDDLCNKCNRPSEGIYGTFIMVKDKIFCSEVCKDADMGRYYVVGGLGITVFFVIFTMAYAIIGLFGLLVGIAVVVYGLDRQSLALPTIRTQFDYEIIPNNDKSEPENLMIYSSILKSKVRPCCLQSARLQDRYCACGRALEYPAET